MPPAACPSIRYFCGPYIGVLKPERSNHTPAGPHRLTSAGNPDAIDYPIARMCDHPVTALEPVDDLGDDAVALPGLYMLRSRASAVVDEYRPVLAVPEERGQWHGKDVARFRQHHPRLDLVAMPETLPALVGREIDNHVDALLLDAERGNLQEAKWLDEPNSPFEQSVATPIVDNDALSRLDSYGIHRQVINDDLEVIRIADLHQRVTLANDSLAAVGYLKNAATDR